VRLGRDEKKEEERFSVETNGDETKFQINFYS
jgi:hypothetical protein